MTLIKACLRLGWASDKPYKDLPESQNLPKLIIDLTFVNTAPNCTSAGVATMSVADHLINNVIFLKSVVRTRCTSIYTRSFKHLNVDSLLMDLCKVYIYDWDTADTVEESSQLWKSPFSASCNWPGTHKISLCGKEGTYHLEWGGCSPTQNLRGVPWGGHQNW